MKKILLGLCLITSISINVQAVLGHGEEAENPGGARVAHGYQARWSRDGTCNNFIQDTLLSKYPLTFEGLDDRQRQALLHYISVSYRGVGGPATNPRITANMINNFNTQVIREPVAFRVYYDTVYLPAQNRVSEPMDTSPDSEEDEDE